MSVTPAGSDRIRTKRHLTRWTVLTVILLLVACVVWVGVRGVLAKNHLERAVSLATQVEAQVKSGDSKGAQATAVRLSDETHAARRLTGDPIWRGAEIVPLAGPNLTAVRKVSGILADVSDNAIGPVAQVLGRVDVARFKPVDGAIDLKPLVSAQPAIAGATKDLKTNLRDAKRIDTSGTVSQVDSAVDQLVDVLGTATTAATSADQAVGLLPEMMGDGSPKNYLLLFQNNAEVRAGGGIPGALALIHADRGRLTLVKQASSADFPQLSAPVLKLPVETEGIYGSITGEFVQDVTLTPRFALSAEIARAMWKQKYGTTVDGVLSIDPVALGYVLGATGDVTLPTGDVLTSGNVVATLLSDSYAKYQDPAVQDEFFAGAAGAIFSRVASGSFDPQSFLTALARAGDERRLLLWSADPAQQKTIDRTSLAGGLPEGTARKPAFGVYLNDSTGAKMDYYLRSQVGVGQAQCRKDGRPTYDVSVTLTSTAPADAATSLSPYVTGGGDYGVTPGDIQTSVSIYAPKTGVFVSASQDDKTVAVHTAADSGYPVTQFEAVVKPGKSTVFTVRYIGPTGATILPSVDQTPLVNLSETKKMTVSCE